MMCHKIGRSPTGTMGLGRYSVSSRKRVPKPPQNITTFIFLMQIELSEQACYGADQNNQSQTRQIQGDLSCILLWRSRIRLLCLCNFCSSAQQKAQAVHHDDNGAAF